MSFPCHAGHCKHFWINLHRIKIHIISELMKDCIIWRHIVHHIDCVVKTSSYGGEWRNCSRGAISFRPPGGYANNVEYVWTFYRPGSEVLKNVHTIIVLSLLNSQHLKENTVSGK